MNGWWSDLDREIRDCLDRHGAMTPGEIGDKLGVSEKAAASLLSMLASEGKVRIALVESPEAPEAEARRPL